MKRNTNNKQQGQILLITVMLLATALTVVLTTAFTGTTDTKITKLEQDQQKALAAAEAGVEAALKQGANQNIGGLGLGSGISGTATITTAGTDQAFVTSEQAVDQQYTYYVAGYDSSSGTFGATWNGSLYINYGSKEGTACADLSLDISIISDNGGGTYTVKKLAAIDGPPDPDIKDSSEPGDPIDSVNFSCKTHSVSFGSGGDYPNAKVIIVRIVGTGSQLGFKTASSTLPAQGKLVTSEAKTQTGASRKVQLFQTYPQIPAELFVTSF